jgi:1-acyl-sn-glycerol-3-phosphate acyltransferase
MKPSDMMTPEAVGPLKPLKDDRAVVAQRILHAVRDLALEVRPQLGRGLAVTLDSNLDRDLGFDSLGRAELVLRVDRMFQIRLPDALIGEMNSPADLLAAVLAAGPAADFARRVEATPLPALPSVAAPESAGTLIEALTWHVREHPSRPHILLWRSEEAALPITYAELDLAARRVAQGLLARGLGQGDRVAIMLPTGAEFFHTFSGILLAGGVPVPIYPPTRRAQIEEHMRRQAGILRNAEASVLITNEEIRPVGRLLHGLVETLRQVETVPSLSAAEPLATPVPASLDTTALIQYTSGSTGDPKGVVLSRANLLANIRAMGQAIGASSADRFVSWLPLYHDMGLIGAWFGCLYYGVPSVIMPPLAFLADPARWLRAIDTHRATLSAAPNFAFELCLKNIRDEDIEGLDLSSLRMVVNGAESVSPSTIRRFSERFARYGLKPEAMAPVYGLAEDAVGLAFPPPGRAPIIDRVDRTALSRDGIAMPGKPDGPSIVEFVACGRPIPGHQVRIVDDMDRELPDRHEGRLQFKGPSATKGYFRNEEKNRTLFCGDWLESGDRAYIAAGDIFITGRIKDMIIRAGRNIYPQELEEHIGGVEGVRKGCVAAFATQDPRAGTERLVVVAETRLTDAAALEQLRRRIAEASSALLDLPPDEIVLARPGAVPKTSSGKLRRSSARQLYESGAIGAEARSVRLQLLRLSLSGIAHRLRRWDNAIREFAFAAWWWTLLCCVAAPAWLLVLSLPRRSWRHAVIHRFARAFLRLTGAHLTIEAEAPVPSARVMLVANHSSYLDAVVLPAAIPGQLSFVAKEELAHQFVAGPFLRRIGTLFARRFDPQAGIEDTEAQLQAARAGERIISMPEGTFTRMPGLLSFHMGAFLVAAEAGIPVIPITITGTRSALRGDQWFPRHSHIRVHIGAPLAPSGTGFEAALRLRDTARALILSQCGEPDLAHEKPI